MQRPSRNRRNAVNEPQTGIFAEGTPHQIFLEFELHAGAAPRELPGRALALAAPPGGEQVVAFGPRLAASLAAAPMPDAAFAFAPVNGLEGHAAPATQRDLFVWLHGSQRDELFARALAWRDALAGCAALAAEAHGFRFRDGRDLTGFEDGTANPQGEARHAVALIDAGCCAGGSFLLAQRWIHDLAGFAALPVADQERVIGRTKADSVELTGAAMPADSHVSRTDLKRDGQAVRIYRRSSPVGGVSDAGLYFLAFSAEVERYRQLLASMFGVVGDGRRDRLLSFSRPISGSFFYAPPREALALAFGDGD